MIFVQPRCNNCSSSVVTLARPQTFSSAKKIQLPLPYGSPQSPTGSLGNQLPDKLCQPLDKQSIPFTSYHTKQLIIFIIITLVFSHSFIPDLTLGCSTNPSHHNLFLTCRTDCMNYSTTKHFILLPDQLGHYGTLMSCTLHNA